MSVIGRFVPYHLRCCYGLTEVACDCFLVRVLAIYARLDACQGFLFEQ